MRQHQSQREIPRFGAARHHTLVRQQHSPHGSAYIPAISRDPDFKGFTYGHIKTFPVGGAPHTPCAIGAERYRGGAVLLTDIGSQEAYSRIVSKILHAYTHEDESVEPKTHNNKMECSSLMYQLQIIIMNR